MTAPSPRPAIPTIQSCPECGGTGTVWHPSSYGHRRACPRCGGARIVTVTVPPAITPGVLW